MSIASEITRLQTAKSGILSAISAKGVTVPTTATLSDCPELISAISGGGGFDIDSIVNIVPINKIVFVDNNGFIGFDVTNFFQTRGATFNYNYAILSKGDDYSSKGLGQVTFYTPASNNIGGRVYNTVVIGGKEWMAENLDFKFTGLAVGQSGTSTTEPRANYYNNNEAQYGISGNKYGLLYNWFAVNYLNTNRAELIPGWHVPSLAEWNALANAVGGSSIAGTKLKSTTGWSSGNGDGSYGFDAFPAGYYHGGFTGISSYSMLWTISKATETTASAMYFTSNDAVQTLTNQTYFEASLRLVKDSE